MNAPVKANSIKAQAAVMRERKAPMAFETLTLEEPRVDEVLVRLVATGVCHTDISMLNHREMTPVPVVLGHEGAGIVERVGAGVRKVKPGDHVVMTFMYCGQCRNCAQGHPAYCEHQFRLCFGSAREDGSTSASSAQGPVYNHFFGQSSFASYSLAHERNVVKVTKDVPLELLGPLGCGIQTGAGAVINQLDVKPGDSVAVFGTGSVGLSALMAARVVGATTIIAIDPVPARLAMAKELGATHLINPADGDPIDLVKTLSGGGVDFALNTTGITAVFTQSLEVTRMRGTTAFFTGGSDFMRTLDARNFLGYGRRLFSVLEGDSVPDTFIPALIELYRQGRFPFDKMVKFYPFAEINQAFADSASGVSIKPIVRF